MTTLNRKDIFLIIITLLVCGTMLYRETHKEPVSSPKGTPASTNTVATDLEVTYKTSASQPALEGTQKHTAVINGEKVEVPVRNARSEGSAKTDSDPLDSVGAARTATSLRQEIDVSPLVDKMIPNWEAGIGVGITKEGTNEIYIPLSLQRNYKFDKAIQFELHVDPSDRSVDGIEVQHKWRF